MAIGLTASEIGERLKISARTARAHVEVLKRKLGAGHSRQLPIAYRIATGSDPLELVAPPEAKHLLARSRSSAR